MCVLVLTTVPPATALPKYWQPNLISLPSLSFSPLSFLTLSGLGCYPFLWASDNIPSSQVSLSVSPPFSLFVCRFSLSLSLPPSLFAAYGCVRCCKDAASLCQFHIETVVIFYCRTEVADAFAMFPPDLCFCLLSCHFGEGVCVNVSYVFCSCFLVIIQDPRTYRAVYIPILHRFVVFFFVCTWLYLSSVSVSVSTCLDTPRQSFCLAVSLSHSSGVHTGKTHYPH